MPVREALLRKIEPTGGCLQYIMNTDETDHHIFFMELALEEAICAYQKGEVPIGAIAVHKKNVIAKAHNSVECFRNPTAHAELLTITRSCAFLKDWRLQDVTLYVTKEPCPMCAGAMVNSKLGALVFGAYDYRYGAAGSALNVTGFPGNLHSVSVLSGILELPCLEIIQSFFREQRQKKNKKSKK